MAHLVFDNSTHMLTLYSSSGGELGSWTAYNNAQRSSAGPAFATNGCIRTSDAAMGTVDTTHGSDRIDRLDVR